MFRSDDLGKTFRPVGTAAVSPAGTDLGDAALLVRREGEIWISYRQNRHRGADADDPTYTVRTARSLDGGRTWQPPVVVAESRPGPGGPSRGLWASCLFERGDGTLQVYYDDEDTPFRRGFRGHQWVTMKTWDAAAGAWLSPVIAARAKDPAHLSREGMMSVVETAPGRLLMAFESVQVAVPHANLIRGVRSDDGGATWSWQTTGREVIYEPPTRPFMALAPWLSPLGQAGQFRVRVLHGRGPRKGRHIGHAAARVAHGRQVRDQRRRRPHVVGVAAGGGGVAPLLPARRGRDG